MATKTKRTGRPPMFGYKMKKTSITLPPKLVAMLEEARKESGFNSVAEQARYELMEPRGLWPKITPVKPTQSAPGKG